MIELASQASVGGHSASVSTGTDAVWDAWNSMATATERQLASVERRYRDLARQLSEVGYIASGSIARRATRCGRTDCACAADPPRLHGPYWHFTAKVDGKTVNKRLSEHEAQLYGDWIGNDRTVRSLLAQMRTVAGEAQALILAEEPPDRAKPGSRGGSPEKRHAADTRGR